MLSWVCVQRTADGAIGSGRGPPACRGGGNRGAGSAEGRMSAKLLTPSLHGALALSSCFQATVQRVSQLEGKH